ncbi:TY-Chap domain-containing protein [Nocardia amikacinitolerans]|uniref:TY-Chap domain-containing protein n=1 Tax=Nocardia amikacinitolerans TaxID=756689 RepID=UPI003556EB55
MWAEIVDDSALVGGYRVSPDDAAWLSSHGWAPPREAGSPNWHRRVPWPAHYNEYEVIADQVVEVLRGVLRIGSPAELTVDSWVNFSNDKFDVSALG